MGFASLALKGAAALGGTRFGNALRLNSNPYFRIGPGVWPGYSQRVPRISSPYLEWATPGQKVKGHVLLTGPPVPPVGILKPIPACR
jgi:hypothetical protein